MGDGSGTADELRRALAALDGGRDDEALDAVAAAWRQRRAPSLARLAQLLERRSPSPLGRQLAALFAPRVDASLANLQRVGAIDHPLVADFALRALEEPPFVGPSAQPLLAELIALAERLGDARLVERAPAIARTWQARVTPKPARVALVAALERAAAKLAQRAAGDGDVDGEERALVDALAARLDRVAASGRTAAELFAAVHAAPDDDGARLVLADFLLEAGDPRGELIVLQFKRRDHGLDAAEQAREAALLKQHGRAWLGPLATVLSWGKSYSDTAFERGFVSVADVMESAKKALPLVLDDPGWATVEELRGFFPTELLLRAPLRGLKFLGRGSMTLSRERIATLDAAGRSLPMVRLYTYADVPPEQIVRVFPRLRQLTVHFVTAPATAEALAPWLRLPLSRLVIDVPFSHGDIDPAAVRAHEALIAAVERLPVTVEEVALQPPFRAPKPPPVALRRGPDGCYRRRA